ncbi:hypothetical protein EA658_04640 [Pseudoxanthomonas winnipegensis]|uniref:Uncharacterized protein n=1 Tax=Pseudoxanthomonas winnipegensis TaxID=2480810 RepID=A0ABY1WJD0_9GAMM|nr:hypothetical protein [Pseudoxanthomonas winnipegensis]TAA09762.1 hypothetical protein EA659_09280 [Pseudoxanthomonas winnipegensis]TAA22859.1 hypothetical protein EA658_04640 [Pseudoxanthomonas winnipegensis]TAH73271.1 hypothetical protein EA657_06180 [Pseudoxanthomonas winnipegensis]
MLLSNRTRVGALRPPQAVRVAGSAERVRQIAPSAGAAALVARPKRTCHAGSLLPAAFAAGEAHSRLATTMSPLNQTAARASRDAAMQLAKIVMISNLYLN